MTNNIVQFPGAPPPTVQFPSAPPPAAEPASPVPEKNSEAAMHIFRSGGKVAAVQVVEELLEFTRSVGYTGPVHTRVDLAHPGVKGLDDFPEFDGVMLLAWSYTFHLHDFRIDIEGLSATLSFDGKPSRHVTVPWGAVQFIQANIPTEVLPENYVSKSDQLTVRVHTAGGQCTHMDLLLPLEGRIFSRELVRYRTHYWWQTHSPEEPGVPR